MSCHITNQSYHHSQFTSHILSHHMSCDITNQPLLPSLLSHIRFPPPNKKNTLHSYLTRPPFLLPLTFFILTSLSLTSLPRP
ncbi:hypothetical protein Scep_005096 [Stephania cephalantha]|uniref:Uncharacterized protein n=1 Tax=Stephania cephalantha TaxID=152367 RepID=A0AAP0KVD8_9MAGN